MAKLGGVCREGGESGLNAYMANLEVSIGDFEEDLATLVGNDDTFRASQYPVGSSRYKSFAAKIERERTELRKLVRDMQGEQGEVDFRRTQMFIDAIARHKQSMEKDLPALVPAITQTHGALTTTELDILHGYDNLLSPSSRRPPIPSPSSHCPPLSMTRL